MGEDLQQHNQKLEFLLRGDSRLQVDRKSVLQAGDLVVRSGATFTRDEEIDLTLQVNELGNVGANNEIINLKVLVVSGGEAPMLDTAGLDAHFAANPLKVREHAAGQDEVETAGLPADFGSFASHGGGQTISFSISPSGDILAIDGEGMLTLADPAYGVAYDTAEDATNTESFTVTANDGTRNVRYTISVAITTNKAQANVADDRVTHEDGDDTDELPDHFVAVLSVDLREDDRGEMVVDLKDLITGADTPETLDYDIVSSKPEFDIGSNAGDSLLVLSYVPDPDDVDYGADDVLSYTGANAVVVTIDDGYQNELNDPVLDAAGVPVDPPAYEPDLELILSITVNVTPPPAQQYPVAEVDVDENLTNVVVLPADNAKLAEIIGDAIGDVEVTHAGGSGAGAIGANNFEVAPDTGAVTVTKAGGLNYEVDGAQHTLTLRVMRVSDEVQLGSVTVVLAVNDVNEAPEFASDAPSTAWVAEDAQDTHSVMTSDLQEAVAFVVTADDQDGDTLSYSVLGSDGSAVPFAVSSSGALTVSGNNALDHEVTPSYSVVITANDGALNGTLDVTITIGNSNEAPYFVNPTLEVDVDEDAAPGYVIETYTAHDPDDIVLEFTLKNQDDTTHFSLGLLTGVLTIASGLDYETQQVHLVEINVTDTSEASAEIQLTVNVTDVNDNRPAFDTTPNISLTIPENTARGVKVGHNYSATDADRSGADPVTYNLIGTDAKSFHIFNLGDDIDGDGVADDDKYSAGELLTLESLGLRPRIVEQHSWRSVPRL